MRLQFGPFLVILAALSVPLAEAQTGSSDSSQSGSTESSPQEQSANGPQPVFTHPENNPPLALLDEVTSHNFITLGLGASAAYDTDAAGFSTPSRSQTQGMYSASVELTQTRPKLTWSLGAVGGLTTSNVPGYNTLGSSSAHLSLLYQISQRWQFAVMDNYSVSADPFQQYTTNSGTPTFNQPNPTTYAPLTTAGSNYGAIDLTYQMSAHDSITFTGTQSFTQYLYSTNSNPLYNQYSWGGVAQYQHVFSPRFSAGGSYGYTVVDYGNGQSRSGIQSIQAFATYKLGQHMSLTGWIGPQYTATKNVVPVFCNPFGCFYEVFHNASWSPSFGGNFGWRGLRNSAVFSFSRSISNGGTLFGIVKLYQVNGNYTRQLNPRWSTNLSILYGNNTGYSTSVHAQHLSSFTGYASLARQLTPALSATLAYAYFNETEKNLFGASVPRWIDNHFQFTLRYTWGHSLGR